MSAAVEIKLSPDQEAAEEQILQFIKERRALLTIGGFAGVGKTHVLAHVVSSIEEDARPRIAFCAFTGKAASVLRAKLEAMDTLKENDYCGTIHGLIYRPIFNDKKQICGFEKRDKFDINYELIIADEASMIDEITFNDLSSFGIPILAAGDHGQLPPVMGKFNLMERPDVRLEKIHRQAADNPIIKLSMMARLDGYVPVGEYGAGVKKIAGREALYDMAISREDLPLFLCGKNDTRVRVNTFVRKKLCIASERPIAGDRLICLKNNRKRGIYNGMTGVLNKISPLRDHWYWAEIQLEGAPEFIGTISKHQFNQRYPLREVPGIEADKIGNLFDFGYCLTVHKAQGSESNNVIVLEERMSAQTDDTWRRWLYTAITRSKERLLLVE